MKTYYSEFTDSAKGSAAFVSSAGSTIVYLYRRSSTALTDSDKPNANVVYTFATGNIDKSLVTNGWSVTMPAGTNTLYVVAATAYSTPSEPVESVTILSRQWSTPTSIAQSTLQGTNSKTVYLYRRNSVNTAPSTPGATTYTVSTDILSGTLSGWTQQPSTDKSQGIYNFMTYATVFATGATDPIGTLEWATPVLLNIDGEDGVAGISPITVTLNKPSVSIPTDADGLNQIYSASGDTQISVSEGVTTLTYNGVGTSNGTWKITSTSTVATLSGVVITGTAGQFSCSAAPVTLAVGTPIVISGTFGGTGSISGYTNPKTYYIIATNGSTTFTISATLNGAAITTTAGTPTGLTYSITAIAAGSVSVGGGGTHAKYSAVSSMVADTAFIEYTVQGTNSNGVAFSGLKTTQTFSKVRGAIVDTTPPANVTGAITFSNKTAAVNSEGTTVCTLTATWNKVADTDTAFYEVEISKTSGANFVRSTATLVSGNTVSYTWDSLEPLTTYYVRVRAVDASFNRSVAWSTEYSTTTVGDTIAPAAPASVTATATFKSIFLAWPNASDKDLAAVKIYETNAAGTTATLVATVPAAAGQNGNYTITNLTSNSTKYYKLTSVDTSDNESGYSPVSNIATTSQVASVDIGAAVIDTLNFASNIEPVTNVSFTTTPPTTKTTNTIFNTTNGKLYRWNGSAYIVSTPAADIIDQLVSSQIADGAVTAKKLVVSDLTNLVDDGGFESGGGGWDSNTIASISTISSPRVGGTKGLVVTGSGIIKDYNFAPIDVQPGDSFYAECWVRKETASTVGTVGLYSTISLDGTGLAYPTLQSIAVSALTQGVWTKLSGVYTIPSGYNRFILRTSLRADVPSGTFTFDDVILRRRNGGELVVDGAITAAKIAANTITANEIAADTITAGQIAAGAISASEIASNAITTSKMTVTGSNLIPNSDFSTGDFSSWRPFTNTGLQSVVAAPTPSIATTAMSRTGSAATLTFANQNYIPFNIGDTITVSGAVPTTYNGTFTVTGATPSSVTYASTLANETVTTQGSIVNKSIPTANVAKFSYDTPATVALTGASWATNTATLTFASGAYTFAVGNTIVVSGVTPTGYNGVYTVTGATPTSVSYARTTTLAAGTGGTVSLGANIGTFTHDKVYSDVGANDDGFAVDSGEEYNLTIHALKSTDYTAYSGLNLIAFFYKSDGTYTTSITATLFPLVKTIATTGDGTTATLTFPTQLIAPYAVGDTISVTGVAPSAYRGTYTVTGATASSVSYENTTTGAQTAPGTITLLSTATAGANYKASTITPNDLSAVGWNQYIGKFTVPVGATRCWIYIYNQGHLTGDLYWTKFRVIRRNNAQLIVDGSITTNSMNANTISGTVIKAETLHGDKIIANTLTADKIAVPASGTFLNPAITIDGTGTTIGNVNTGTAKYRTTGVPTNNPTPTTVGVTANTNGTRNIQVNWNQYTQGTNQADFLILYWKKAATAPTRTDASVALDVNTTGASYYIFEGVNPADTFSFGIAAARRTENGLEIGTIQTVAAWTNVAVATANYTANVGGTSAATVVSNAAAGAAVATNFNANNDRNTSTPTNPTIPTGGAAIDHTVNTDGSVDISFEWLYTTSTVASDPNNIDGFFVYMYSSTSSGAYTLGTTPALEQVSTVPSSIRAMLFSGLPANRYYTFGVQAYRSVDSDIDSTGVKVSSVVKSTVAGENPYQPSATVAFAGNITGTVDGTAAATVVSGSALGAQNPATRINDVANTVLITPGKIQISGSTPLSSWIYGSGTTINGDVIEANTIKANAVEIGVRGVRTADLMFEAQRINNVPTNVVTWTDGNIYWTGTNGEIGRGLDAGSATWSAGTYSAANMYLYWVRPPESVSSFSFSGTTVTLNYADYGSAPFNVGESIRVTGFTGPNAGNVNGVFSVVTCTATSLTYVATGVTTGMTNAANDIRLNSQINYTASTSNITSLGIANRDNAIILAVFKGSASPSSTDIANLTTNYGKTIIDGNSITTNSIKADKIEADTIFGQRLYLGNNNFILNGDAYTGVGESGNQGLLTIKNAGGTTDIVKLGYLSATTTGFELRNDAGDLLLATSTPASSIDNGQTGVNVCNIVYSQFNQATLPSIATTSSTGTFSVSLDPYVSGFPVVGIGSLKLTTGASSLCYAVLAASLSTYNIVLKPNTKYLYSAYVKASVASSTAQLRIRFDDTGTDISTSFTTSGTANTWTRVSTTFTTNATTTSAVARLGSTTSSNNLWFSGIMIEEARGLGATTPSPYVAPAITGQITASNTSTYISSLRADVIQIDNVRLDTDGSGNLTIKALGVDTAYIANNAATRAVSAYTDGSISLAGYPVIQSVSITTTGSLVQILFAFAAISSTSTQYRIKRGTTIIFTAAAGAFSSVNSFLIGDTPAAGTYTYSLEASGVDINGNPISASQRSLFVTEFKK